MEFAFYLWILIQIIFGFNLILPFVLYLFWLIKSKHRFEKQSGGDSTADYAIIVTAYKQTHTLPYVVDSILKANYQNYLVYIVADNCDISDLNFADSRIIVLRPPEILASNTKSHRYAFDNFQRVHDRVTIVDSDNLLDAQYFVEMNKVFQQGFFAVQGVRKPKNTNTDIAALDAVRDIYYHFYDGKVLFELGSSATLAGSGMAFDCKIYREFLTAMNVEGAGFDKVLQAWLLKSGSRIAFAEYAIVYDEKTSQNDQLVKQRSRWINTWFKYFGLGFGIVFKGLKDLNLNQFLFGLVLLRPPLFIFILVSGVFAFINLFISLTAFLIWILSFVLFVAGFYIALKNSNTDSGIYKALLKAPQFIYLQVVSLLKSRNANKNSVSTTHYYNSNVDDIKS